MLIRSRNVNVTAFLEIIWELISGATNRITTRAFKDAGRSLFLRLRDDAKKVVSIGVSGSRNLVDSATQYT